MAKIICDPDTKHWLLPVPYFDDTGPLFAGSKKIVGSPVHSIYAEHIRSIIDAC